mmetsp:Transcript_2707/g.6351  ORF Transcript_2707/g.6351 Transcript_2707/m.6351 type:complete len:535 (+) Transcript_2707:3-1607(+)
MAEDESWDCSHLHGYGIPDHNPSRLQSIVERVRVDLQKRMMQVPHSEVEAKAAGFVRDHGKPVELAARIQEGMAARDGWKVALAAEFKRASPSKGDIAPDLEPAEVARQYSRAGAAVLSVLTEPVWFKGTCDDLLAVRMAAENRPAILRKDFVVDEYQIVEGLAYGADTVLLMVSILPRSKLRSLLACCRRHGMEPLVEVVNEVEMQIAVSEGATVIGVNNRNLHTFELDPHRTDRLALLAGSAVLLALSGISNAEEVDRYAKIGCHGVLVGESLMRATNIERAISGLMRGCVASDVLAKVCGVTNVEDATAAARAGANLIGLIFVSKSKRSVTRSVAAPIIDTVNSFSERAGIIDWSDRSTTALRRHARRPLIVGVFMDHSVDEVVSAVRDGIAIVQLHGQEDAAYMKELRSRLTTFIVKVLHIPPAGSTGVDVDAFRAQVSDVMQHADAILLDTAVKGESGGTGVAFDWTLAEQVARWAPTFVAGGLTAGNVGDLLKRVRPLGVDVASGVEASPGKKDVGKVKAFVTAVKAA